MGDVYKIIDLDVGRSFENQNSNKHNHLNKENLFMQSINGTVAWMSPELQTALHTKQKQILTDPYRADIYSLGIVLLQLCYCEWININKQKLNQQQLLYKVDNIFNLGYSKKLVNLLKRMLDPINNRRPDFKQLGKEFGISNIFESAGKSNDLLEIKNMEEKIQLELFKLKNEQYQKD